MKDSKVELETRLAFLEDTVNALDRVVSGHEQAIERLERALMVVQQALRSMSDSGSADDEAPPHY